MSACRKLEIVCELTRNERERILSEVRRDYPDAGQREQKLRMATQFYGPELMLRVFGWDAEKEG